AREEAYLTRKCGDASRPYTTRVRRWLSSHPSPCAGRPERHASMIHRLHILGASGSGTTTWGCVLALDRHTPWDGQIVRPYHVPGARHHQRERLHHTVRYAGAL